MYGRLRVLGVPSFRQVVDEERDKKFIVSFLSVRIDIIGQTDNFAKCAREMRIWPLF